MLIFSLGRFSWWVRCSWGGANWFFWDDHGYMITQKLKQKERYKRPSFSSFTFVRRLSVRRLLVSVSVSRVLFCLIIKFKLNLSGFILIFIWFTMHYTEYVSAHEKAFQCRICSKIRTINTEDSSKSSSALLFMSQNFERSLLN